MSKETKEQSMGEKKLSQLLGEYMEEKKKNPEGFLDISTALMIGGKAGDVYMISKHFGFIEWLVQNNKIDFEKKLNTLKFESLVDQILDSYLALLMVLAIQDEPVKFLSEILKDE